MEDKKNQYAIASVENAFTLLERIVKSRAEVSAIELYALTGIPKATIHKELQTLCLLGYIEQNPKTNRYYTTMKILQLGYYCINRRGFFDQYHPYVKLYMKKFGCPVSLSIYSGEKSITVFATTNNERLENVNMTGKTLPIYLTASGRLLLASMDDARARLLLENMPLIPETEYTICDVDLLMQEIGKARRGGYCKLSQEISYGFDMYAFPLRDTVGGLIGSMTLVLRTDAAEQVMQPDVIAGIQEMLDKVRLSSD
ncbi:MAG TPA: IclR family transcriptional regulator [Terriglobales bacterium]|nr:IclR family transcriptional regulator [Terriglobales bacterium]